MCVCVVLIAYSIARLHGNPSTSCRETAAVRPAARGPAVEPANQPSTTTIMWMIIPWLEAIYGRYPW